jgi:polyphosphate kinase
MPRNFYHRVELMFPIASQPLRQKIYRDIVTPIMSDNCRAYELRSDGTYARRVPMAGEIKRDAQQILMDFYRTDGPTGLEPRAQ